MQATSSPRLDADDRVQLAQLRKVFHESGWQRKPTGRLMLELARQLLITSAGLAVIVLSDFWLVDAAGFLIATIGTAGVVTHTHTSSHYATSSRRWVNDALTYFGYPMFVGLSATYWRHKHMVVHHRAPNVIGVDDDADLAPWFALTKEEAARGGRIKQFYYERVQRWVIPIAIAANGFNMQIASWRFLLQALSGPRRRREHWLDLGSMLLHYVFCLGVPLFWFAASDVLLVYVIRIVLMGYAMFAILAPGHFPAEALRVDSNVPIDELSLQTGASINFTTGWLGRLMCSGLEYQIEHHLFPLMPRNKLGEARKIIKTFCQRHDISYYETGTFRSYREILAYLHWVSAPLRGWPRFGRPWDRSNREKSPGTAKAVIAP